MKIFTIKEGRFLQPIITQVVTAAREALQGGAIEILLMRPSKTRVQEKKYHAMIGDIARTVDLGGNSYDEEIWKAWLVDEFEQELKANGLQLKNPGRVVLSRDGKRLITLRAPTSKFNLKEGSMFIEFLYYQAQELEARLTDRSLSYYDEIQQRRAA